MQPIVVIPARGGSKGVPGKNIKVLNDKPLIQYTIDAARHVFKDNEICVSTDDNIIKSTVESLGLRVPFLRPAHLATDTATSRDVLLHALQYHEAQHKKTPDVIVLLQPTSPFRTAEHIKEALVLYNEKLDMVVSVKETKANPYYVLMEEDDKGFLVKSKVSNSTRRQDVPKVWEVNGAIYIINPKSLKNKTFAAFKKVIKYKMDEMSSHDIDTMLDWRIAEGISKDLLF
ncbi:acylneuraminate cytidylyltransferase family protein [uncultured Winogradskyella sp.]|uniref:acylneuraminate cytidylyltransferase family protein n=1 Tax=uncultured Winogradskyella sp. TaxID=395353 RepID=UPI0026069D2A|nr:acylneuraminate cytidylyltransferase family protein [uncultured Winogradskyella sp.]